MSEEYNNENGQNMNESESGNINGHEQVSENSKGTEIFNDIQNKINEQKKQDSDQEYVSKYPSEEKIEPYSPANSLNVQNDFYVNEHVENHNSQDKSKIKKEKSSAWFGISIVCMLCTAICAGVLVYVLFRQPHTQQPQEQGQQQQQQDQTPQINKNDTPDYIHQNTEGEAMDSTSVIQKMLPSVVMIEVTKANAQGGGSGIIMTQDGYVLTNAHVIDGAKTVTVKTNDGKEYTAKIIGYDTSSDVGVVKIEGSFQAAEFGDSDKVVPGETVIAIGTPYSEDLFQTATKGMVSSLRYGLTFKSLGLTLDLIQHDAAINSGNSGGPLVNQYGQVIGVNSVKMSGEYENLSFALQINGVLKVANDIITKGAVERPLIGITGSTEPTIGGVKVADVQENGAAAEAGIKIGDVITKLNDTRVKSIDELTSLINKMAVGDEITLTLIRDGEMTTVKLKLGSSLA